MGIFDRNTAGHETAPINVTVERGAVAFFAETIGETNPIHFDADAARAAGHPDVVTPATYPVVIEMAAAKIGKRNGVPDTQDVIKVDNRYVLHGSESYTYHGPIYAGDTVEVISRVKSFADAKGGALEIANLELEIRHPERGVLAVAERTLIHRLPKEKQG
ncbi:MaoC family dehydratase N-terminal domain-containing protein [Shimia thalassica]|jgi:acyl dehydratase|uniref:FAS1-like dehydratase domain-containing protein n=1 Tax=Shimia thalassica TaxID=1715693 RepID=UPI001C0A2272|nr:MaoC family dehydratase N-terminal domain-containing protein [Shimia thalassica]MBU2942878.1 MaoC family dehydratase N-terminal domain-containing protein [Shimia thalassica]MDO6480045.1 MaoC family dehydratase N-terminal domain-containing protein [Shimia thalassica]MDO6502354.1 MaoC family dehydratase N-terminal domain-containing protein [Shimia thalassica]MDO6520818.1 MaoC family dehydratase N-terminal domain-containing protein [Shimia thalassica]MDO6799539.1 MaoC family dehydratase N-term